MSRIREIRERLKLSQADFGKAIGCTQGNVGFYERGEQSMPVERAERLIDVAARDGLHLTLDQVYGRTPLPAGRAKPAEPQKAT
jgi:putative transcriptional regulator